jgi:protein tyrosine/serine phosphatase
MVKAYKSILNNGVDAYRCVIEHMVDHPDSAVLVHCTAGKDRTGVICALLLSFGGVEDAVVAEEYALTEQGLAPWIDLIVEAIMKSTNCTREEARRMAGARKESILGTLELLRDEYGGVEGYFRDWCRISNDRLEKLKAMLVVDEKPVCGL